MALPMRDVPIARIVCAAKFERDRVRYVPGFADLNWPLADMANAVLAVEERDQFSLGVAMTLGHAATCVGSENATPCSKPHEMINSIKSLISDLDSLDERCPQGMNVFSSSEGMN